MGILQANKKTSEFRKSIIRFYECLLTFVLVNVPNYP